MAESIELDEMFKLQEALLRLEKTGLTRKAIIVLLQDDTGIQRTHIKELLQAIEDFERTHLPGRKRKEEEDIPF